MRPYSGEITENGINRTLRSSWAAHATISGPLALNLPVNLGEIRLFTGIFKKALVAAEKSILAQFPP